MKDEINSLVPDHTKSDIKNEFKEIFCNKYMRHLLGDRVVCTDLWYHCMSQLILMEGEHKFVKDSDERHFKYSIYNIEKLLRVILPSFRSWICPNSRRHASCPVDVMFISRDRFICAKVAEGWIKSDYLFFSVIQKVVQEYPHLKEGLICTSTPPDDLNIDAYNVYQYIRPLDFLKAFLFSLRKTLQWFLYRKKVNNTNASDRHQGSLMFHRVDLFFSFRMLFARYLADCSYSRLFANLRPRIIVSNDDSMQLKPRTTSNDLKFITMQSAVMSPVNELYRRLFITEFGNESVKSDYFLCTGHYFKDLKEFSSVAKKVIITGQPRYDVLSQADKIYDRSKIMEDLGLDPSKKMVLWTTQTHGLSHDENVKNINAVYDAMSSLRDAQLVIKLHPGEDQNAPLYAKDGNCKPLVLGRDADTYGLLFACDLLITKYSTTALEAAVLDKPVIILNLSGKPDREDYVHEGVALGVYIAADLASAIGRSLSDDQLLKQLKVGRERYIEKYLYKNDGKATERVVDLIGSLLSNT